jgi:hypothetical protein
MCVMNLAATLLQVGPLGGLADNQKLDIVPLWRDGEIPWTKHPLGHYSIAWLGEVVSPVRGCWLQMHSWHRISALS